MPEPIDLDDFDPTAPDALDRLMELPDEPEESSEEVPEEESKRNAAFARLRKKNRLMEKAIAAERERQQSNTGQSPPAKTVQSDMGVEDAYEQSVVHRAHQYLAQRNVPQTDPQYASRFLIATGAIMAKDASDNVMQRIKAEQAPSVVNAAFNKAVEKFGFDTEDKAEVRKRLNGLDPQLQANPDIVQKEISSYVGDNLEKFTKPKKKKPEPPTEDFGESVNDGWPTKQSNLEDQSAKAGAAAASQGKSGSRGVTVPTTVPSGDGETKVPRLTKEDRVVMKETGRDPSDPKDVKRYFTSQKIKERKYSD